MRMLRLEVWMLRVRVLEGLRGCAVHHLHAFGVWHSEFEGFRVWGLVGNDERRWEAFRGHARGASVRPPPSRWRVGR